MGIFGVECWAILVLQRFLYLLDPSTGTSPSDLQAYSQTPPQVGQ